MRGAAARATEADYVAAAARIGSGSRELHAVITVESSGAGFYADGRCKMLFEPHVFYRNLAGAQQAQAVKVGLAYPKWGTKPYPKDSYPRLLQAMQINETAALMACSWGLTQILGENQKACGYATPQEMVAAMAAGEAAQLDATVALMAGKGLASALKAHNWAAVAKGWNGAQYAKNRYDTKLAAAYKANAKAPTVSPAPLVAKGKAAAPLPAVAPMGLGQLLAGFFARLTAPAPAAA
ncbi:hypothetical protein MFUR16E_04820 [Methylobacterium fujisawaense]